MKRILSFCLVIALVSLLAPPLLAGTGKDAQERLDNSVAVFSEILNIPEKGIPPSLVKDAKGIIIIPHMIKAGFIVGANRGKGIVIHRLPGGGWSDPAFVTITGGSIGFQIGGQATDLIMIVRSERGFQALLEDNFKFGANASIAAGPVGRDAAAATDAKLKADILSYSRSKGLFAGISLDGAGLTQDRDANQDFYGKKRDIKAIVGTQSKPYPAPGLLKLLRPFTTR